MFDMERKDSSKTESRILGNWITSDGQGKMRAFSRCVSNQWMLSSKIGSVAALNQKRCLLAWDIVQRHAAN
jgi:hypothetical protein